MCFAFYSSQMPKENEKGKKTRPGKIKLKVRRMIK